MADEAAIIAQLQAELRQAHEKIDLLRADAARRERACAEARDQLAAAAELLRVIASSPIDPTRVLPAIASAAARLTSSDSAGIQRVSGQHLDLATAVGELATKTSLAGYLGSALIPGSIPGRAVLERRTVHTPDMATATRSAFPDSRAAYEVLGIQSQLAVPLIREGRPIGVLGAHRFEQRPFTDQEIRLLEMFADQAVIALENARLFQELRDRVGELQALGEVGRAVSSSLDVHEALSTIATNAARVLHADGASVYEYDEATETLQPSGSLRWVVPDDVGEGLARTIRSRGIRVGEGAVGRAVSTRRPVEIPDVLVPGSYDGPVRDALVAANFRSLLAVPLLHQDRPLGALVVVRRAPGRFSPDVVALLETFAGQCTLAIHNARLYRDLEGAARHK